MSSAGSFNNGDVCFVASMVATLFRLLVVKGIGIAVYSGILLALCQRTATKQHVAIPDLRATDLARLLPEIRVVVELHFHDASMRTPNIHDRQV